MRIEEIYRKPSKLYEAKARIDHPEDLVVDEGAAGARRALNAMIGLARDPRSVTIKFDGTPALIFGWDKQGFVLTDKAGFGSKKYDGMTRSAADVEAMLRGDTGRRIMDTTPEGLKARAEFARSIAGLYDMLKALVPQTTEGYIQGDLMWTSTPPLVDGYYRFGPLKITYNIPANSQLGRQIGESRVGMVLHSIFSTPYDIEPKAIDDFAKLDLNNVPGLVIVPHELRMEHQLKLPAKAVASLDKVITSSEPAVNALFNGPVKSLSSLMKSYLAWKAGQGSADYRNSSQEFLDWLSSPASKASDSMQSSVKQQVAANQTGYDAVWYMVAALTSLKLYLKHQLDAKAYGLIKAQFSDAAHPDLRGKPGHEGFVADTEHGKIKLVHRAEFMRKQPETSAINEFASGGSTAAGSVASVANPINGVISRTPSLFGWVPLAPAKKKRKSKSSKSR